VVLFDGALDSQLRATPLDPPPPFHPFSPLWIIRRRYPCRRTLRRYHQRFSGELSSFSPVLLNSLGMTSLERPVN
jgi:hypothetical protein